ncbi:hypothetical protein F5883DRAFT_658992 [Diaporthe sp. PMI_573]|nr:hypothetical protein F5883DRAFT_658992 [Diaporthaceae sp. PMI_573]
MTDFLRKEWPREDCPALRDWAATIRLIKENMNLGGLTLRLTMFDAPGLDYEGIRKGMTKPEAREVRQAYTRILGTMAGLGEEGLKRFYAHIALPEKWTPWFRYKESTGEHFTERILKKERILRERAEQLVMGDRYAKQVGDGFYMNGLIREPFRSVWRRNFINRY